MPRARPLDGLHELLPGQHRDGVLLLVLDAMKAVAFSAYALAAFLLVGLVTLAHRDEEHPVGCICPRHRVRRKRAA